MNVEPEAKTERVLIVGGSSGMGLALARILLEEKAKVTIVGRSEATLAKARRIAKLADHWHQLARSGVKDMPTWSTLILFAAAVSLLVFTPGPNVLYIIARSVNQGRTAGVVSCLGVEVGTLVHVSAASLGISALLLSSALAFNIVKYAGGALPDLPWRQNFAHAGNNRRDGDKRRTQFATHVLASSSSECLEPEDRDVLLRLFATVY